jgi:hypothetical protein
MESRKLMFGRKKKLKDEEEIKGKEESMCMSGELEDGYIKGKIV